MDELQLEEAKKHSNRKSIKFVIALFILYLIFSQGNLFMNSVLNPGGRFYNPSIANSFNYIQGLRTAIIIPSVQLIKLFGFYAVYNYQDILIVDGPLLRISYSCLGFGVMSFLAAFTFAFPASWNASIKMFVQGIIVVYILNVIRIAGLGIVLGLFNSQRRYFEYHHEIFNVIVYLIVFAMLYFWIKKNTSKNSQ